MSALASGPTRVLTPARPGPQTDPASIRLDHDTPELASTYDRTGYRQFEHGKQLVALLALQPGQRVLDVGCGTGLLGAWVAERVSPGGEVVGLDPLTLRVELAARKHPRLRAQVGRAEDLSDLADESFDAVFLNSVLHWVHDQPRALAEARRVLRPGGRIAVNSADAQRPHDSAVLLDRVLGELGLRGPGIGAGGQNHRVDGVRLVELLVNAGFTEVELTHHTFFDRLHDVDELIAWSRSSSFGNWLSDLKPAQLSQVRDRLADALDPLRTSDFIPLRRHLVFAGARRP